MTSSLAANAFTVCPFNYIVGALRHLDMDVLDGFGVNLVVGYEGR